MVTLKAAVIGTGGAARLHMQAYAAAKHTRPVAVVSRDAARAEAFAAEFGVRGYTSVAQMLERERPDVVSVATLEWDHEAPVVESLAGGRACAVREDSGAEIAAGERMVAAAKRAGRSLGVNYNYRSVPSHRLIRQELERGGFGAVGMFSARDACVPVAAFAGPAAVLLRRSGGGAAAMVDDQALRPPVSTGPQGRAMAVWRRISGGDAVPPVDCGFGLAAVSRAGFHCDDGGFGAGAVGAELLVVRAVWDR